LWQLFTSFFSIIYKYEFCKCFFKVFYDFLHFFSRVQKSENPLISTLSAISFFENVEHYSGRFILNYLKISPRIHHRFFKIRKSVHANRHFRRFSLFFFVSPNLLPSNM